MEKEQAEKLLKTVDQMAKEFREILFGKNIEKDELTYDPSNLANGLYRIYWKDGDSSLAAVGCLANGTRSPKHVNSKTSLTRPHKITDIYYHSKVSGMQRLVGNTYGVEKQFWSG